MQERLCIYGVIVTLFVTNLSLPMEVRSRIRSSAFAQRRQDRVEVLHPRVLDDHSSFALLVLNPHLQPKPPLNQIASLAHIRIEWLYYSLRLL